MTQIVKMEGGKVRLSNEDLKRRAAKAIYEGDLLVFQGLPGLIAQIIEHRAWEDFKHSNFADFALDHTSNGLGVNTDARLWLLKCAMHVHGEHLQEWTELLVKVDSMVKMAIKAEGGTIRMLQGNSLETLAKDVRNVPNGTGRITYLPSLSGATDRALVSLRRNHPDMFKRVLAGQIKPRQAIIEVRRADGERVNHDKRPLRVRSDFMLLSDDEKREFIKWLRSEGYVK